MSYDIYLFKELENKTVSESAEIILPSDINSLDLESFIHQKKTLSQKLKAVNSKFEEFNSEDSLILSLNESGIQVSIYANQIAVTVPYWYTDKEAEMIFREIFSYLDIIQRETGYSIYDPQDGSEIKIDRGIDSFLKTYLGVSENIETIVENTERPVNFSNKIHFNNTTIGIIIILIMLLVISLLKKTFLEKKRY